MGRFELGDPHHRSCHFRHVSVISFSSSWCSTESVLQIIRHQLRANILLLPFLPKGSSICPHFGLSVYQRWVGLSFDDSTQTGLVFGLSTVHLSFALHVPWYYLVDGAGRNNNTVVVWSWPSSVILTVRVL
jgi:hypothetical protein